MNVATMLLRFDHGQLVVGLIGVLLTVAGWCAIAGGLPTERREHTSTTAVVVACVLQFVGMVLLFFALSSAYDRAQHVALRAELRDRGYDVVHVDTARTHTAEILAGHCKLHVTLDGATPMLDRDRGRLRLTPALMREIASTSACAKAPR